MILNFFSQNLTFLDQSNVGCITTFCWGNFWSPDLWYNPLVSGPVTWCNPHPPRADPQFTCPWHHWAAIKSIHFDWSTDILYFLFLQGKFMILKHIHPKWVSAVWYPTIPGPPPVPLMTRPTWYLTYQSQAGAGLVLKNPLPVPLMTHPIWFPGYQSPRIAAVRVVPPLRMLWCQLRCPLLARGRVIPLPYYVGASLIASPSPDRTRPR